MSNKNILTPVDFSSNSLQAFDFALQYVRERKATLHLLHVLDLLPKEGKQNVFNETFIMKERMRIANEELKKFVNKIPHHDVKIIESLKPGVAHEQILEYAQKNKINLIILASHGCTAKYNLSVGSVASKIIDLSAVPVVCVRTVKSKMEEKEYMKNSTIAENWVG